MLRSAGVISSTAEDKRSYLTEAVRRYSMLFTFPSYRVIASLLTAVALLGCIATFVTFSTSPASIYNAVIFAISVLTAPTIAVDILLSRFVVRSDDILNRRRMAALSLVTISWWVTVMFIWAIIRSSSRYQELMCGFLFGASSAVSLRLFVIKSVSRLSIVQTILVTALPPGVCVATSLIWFPPLNIILQTLAASLALSLSVYIIIMLLERHGESAVGIGAVSLFQGFLANWLAGLTSPLEAYFERLGRNSEVSVSLLGFRHVDDLRGIFVVPKIHPGPFKNLGSSNLPWLIQKTLEEKTSATVMVPHGTSGHETDLASQRYVEKVLQAIVELARFDCFSDEATPMARAELGNTKATCQIFGGVALVTLTCAPESMEDIPPEVGEEIVARGKALGAKEVIVIDAHNSIGSHRELHMLSNEQLKALRDVAVAAIANALSQRKGRLKFGAARVVPQEWGAKEGLGSGGISVAAICVDNQMVAYVVIDGNNLVSGLREEIIESLKGLVDDAEVLTTDTHAVNALSTVERGYHPIGEAMDRSLLISYVRDCTIMAIKAASISSTAFRYGIIPNVQVIGEDTLRGLSMLVSSSLRLLRLLMCLIYIPALVASALLLIP